MQGSRKQMASKLGANCWMFCSMTAPQIENHLTPQKPAKLKLHQGAPTSKRLCPQRCLCTSTCAIEAAACSNAKPAQFSKLMFWWVTSISLAFPN